MKKQIVIIMMAMAVALLWAAGAMAELSTEEFIKQFMDAIQKEDVKKALQLVMQNPEATKQAQQLLQKAGQGKDENAETAKVIGKKIAQLAQVSQIIQKASPDTSNTAEMKRLQEEGQKAFYAANYPEALAKWKTGLEIAKKVENKQAIGAFLTNIGLVFQYLGQHEEALRHLEESLAICTDIQDKSGEANNLGNIGVVYKNLGQYDNALTYYEKALVIFTDIGDRMGKEHVLDGIHLIYESLKEEGKKIFYTGKYPEALAKWEKGLELAKKAGDKKYIGHFLNNIGVVYRNLGQYEKALICYKEALTISTKSNDKMGEGSNLGNIGLVYADIGQYENALSHYEQAMVIHKEIIDRDGEGKDLNSIGMVYADLGQYDKALSYLERSLAISKEINDKNSEGDDLNSVGLVYADLGQYDKALIYFEQALELFKEIDDRDGKGDALGNIGLFYHNRGQYEKALEYYKQALVIHKEIGDRSSESNDLRNIGSLYLYMGQYEKALEYYEQALEIHKKIGDRSGEGSTLINIGDVFQNLGQYEKSEKKFAESMKIFSDIGVIDSLWRAQVGFGRTEGKLKKYDDAVKHYEQSLDNIEKMREGISEKESRTVFMQNKLFIYDEFIINLKKLHEKDPKKSYDKKSFEIFERKQGRVFLEQMGESGSRNFEGFPDDMREKEIELATRLEKKWAEIAGQRSKSFEQQDKKLIQELDAEIENISKEQSELQESIRKDYPDYYALKYPKPVKLEDLQNTVLQDGEVLLVYNVMEESTCLWIVGVGKEQFGFFPLDIGEKALEEKVNNFRNILISIKYVSSYQLEIKAETSVKKIRETGQELYDLLIPEKARPLISGAKLLYVVPTASLYGLPFEALGSGDRYLLEDHAVAYLSSASLLKILQDAQSRRKEKPVNSLLAFAHPKCGTEDNPCSKKNPSCFSLPENENTADISLDQMMVRGYLKLMGGRICELPETENEVKGIGTLMNAPESAFQLCEKASESNVFAFSQEKKLDDYRYVVFSCHGLLPNTEKTGLVNQPALALSVPDPTDKDRDGFLTMAETFGLKFNADIVVLSACDTGRGDHIRGEGVRGLTRAFMYAGTPAVSVTLWPVADKSSSILSSGFFENREKKEMSLGESLRQIKLDMIQGKHGKIYRHPYFWSPMVVFGIGK